MIKERMRSMPGPEMIALGVFVVALILLMLFGYGFLGALFLSLVLAAAVSALVLFASHPSSDSGGAASSPDRETPSTKPPSGDAGGTTAAPSVSASPAPEPVPEPSPVPEPASAPDAESAPMTATVGTEPERLDAPREGGPDDLKRIKGIGPKLETELHRMGIFHIDQIAGWSEAEVAWMDENLLEFRGRVSRDDWVSQARQLTSGQATGSSGRPEAGEIGD